MKHKKHKRKHSGRVVFILLLCLVAAGVALYASGVLGGKTDRTAPQPTLAAHATATPGAEATPSPEEGLLAAVESPKPEGGEEATPAPQRDRGTVEILDEEIEDELEDEFGQDYTEVVMDPFEELELDALTLTEAFDTLDNVRNILLLGVDTRSSSIPSKGVRTDTMMLLSVDIENRTIKLVSFLRDTYVEVPGNKNNRLNAAYVLGGYDLLSKTLLKNFGIKPDAYVCINLAGLVDVIDQLGGVYVDVPSSKVDRINAVIYWYNIQVLNLKNPRTGFVSKGGYQKLDGRQAEAWARYRYSESDFQRTERQRKLITLIFDKVTQMSATEISAFIMKNIGLVRTNMKLEDMVALAPAVLAMKDAEIKSMSVPYAGAYKSERISGMAVLVPDRQKILSKLRKFYTE